MVDDAKLKFIDNTTGVTAIRFTPPFSAVCGVGGKPFTGTVEIVYQPGMVLLELESFEQHLESLRTHEFTAETLCDYLYKLLAEQLLPASLTVEVSVEYSRSHASVSVLRNSGA